MNPGNCSHVIGIGIFQNKMRIAFKELQLSRILMENIMIYDVMFMRLTYYIHAAYTLLGVILFWGILLSLNVKSM